MLQRRVVPESTASTRKISVLGNIGRQIGHPLQMQGEDVLAQEVEIAMKR